MRSRTGNRALGPFYTMVHPIEGFSDLYDRKAGRVSIGVGVALLGFLQLLATRQLSGFLFNSGTRLNDLNILYLLAQSVGFYLLFTLVNWAVCTLFDGKGHLGGIWIGVTYSMMPMILSGFLQVLLSRFLKQDEALFLQIVSWIGLAWTAFLFVKALEAVHQYTLPQTFLSTAATFVGIAIVLFLVILLLSLSQQMLGFLVTLAKEVMLRTS